MSERHFYEVDTSNIHDKGDDYILNQPGSNAPANMVRDFPALVSDNTWRFCKSLSV